MQLIYNTIRARFEFVCTIDERFAAKNVGFRFDPDSKSWFTDTNTAAQLSQYANQQVAEMLRQHVAKRAEIRRASVAASAEIDAPIGPVCRNKRDKEAA